MESITLRNKFVDLVENEFPNSYPDIRRMASGKDRISIKLKGLKARWIMIDAEPLHLKIVVSCKEDHITEKDLNNTGMPVTEEKGATHIWLSSKRDLIILSFYTNESIDFSNYELLTLLKKSYEGFVSK